MFDHITSLLVTTTVPLKKPEHIARAIMKNWIAVYGSDDNFLTDKSGKFVNDKPLCLWEALNIRLQTLRAKSPCPNGLVERHKFSIVRNVEQSLRRQLSFLWYCT